MLSQLFCLARMSVRESTDIPLRVLQNTRLHEVMALLLHVDCDVSYSVCLHCSNNGRPTVDVQRTASTCECHVAHRTLGFSRCYSKVADHPFFRSISHMRERRHGKPVCSSSGLSLKTGMPLSTVLVVAGKSRHTDLLPEAYCQPSDCRWVEPGDRIPRLHGTLHWQV